VANANSIRLVSVGKAGILELCSSCHIDSVRSRVRLVTNRLTNETIVVLKDASTLYLHSKSVLCFVPWLSTMLCAFAAECRLQVH